MGEWETDYLTQNERPITYFYVRSIRFHFFVLLSNGEIQFHPRSDFDSHFLFSLWGSNADGGIGEWREKKWNSIGIPLAYGLLPIFE